MSHSFPETQSPLSAFPSSSTMPPLSSLSSQLSRPNNSNSSHSFHQAGNVSSFLSPAHQPSTSATSKKTKAPRPSTAPSTSVSPTSHLSSSSPHEKSHAPNLPPIPTILSHSPTRSHLFQFLLRNLHLKALNQLILLLDLLAVIRGHDSQTDWSFEDPFTPPSLSPALHAPKKKTISRKAGLRIRPGTSDGLASSHRVKTRFTMAGASSLNEIRSPSTGSRVATDRDRAKNNGSNKSSWITHFIELYNPPKADLDNGWFIPMQLYPKSSTLEMLSQKLPSLRQPMTINLGVSSLKQVGECGCRELSNLEPVKAWWYQHASLLWKNCAIQSNCQSFHDLLGLWPSEHFPTPSLSQLYKISNDISDFRDRMSSSGMPSDLSTSSHSLIYRAALLGFFEVYLGRPSSKDLSAIDGIVFPPAPPAFQPDKSPSPSTFVGQHLFFQNKRDAALSRKPSRKLMSSDSCSSKISDGQHGKANETVNLQLSHLMDVTSQKLKQFCGDERDRPIPQRNPHLTGCDFRKSSYTEPISPPNSFQPPDTVGLPNNRRKISHERLQERERPRKRSSTSTIDIGLANLKTSHQFDNDQLPSSLTPSQTTKHSGIPYTITQITTVGTSPTNTPTFRNLASSYDLQHPSVHIKNLDNKSPLERSHNGLKTRDFETVNDSKARALKRLTKLERILGEPVDPLVCCAGLEIKVVTEVVEELGRVEDDATSKSQGNKAIALDSRTKKCTHFNDPLNNSCNPISSRKNPSKSSGTHSGIEPVKYHPSSPMKLGSSQATSQAGLNKMTGKWNLEKVHKFFGEVAGHSLHSTTGVESDPYEYHGILPHRERTSKPQVDLFYPQSETLTKSEQMADPTRRIINQKSSDLKLSLDVQTVLEAPEPDSLINGVFRTSNTSVDQHRAGPSTSSTVSVCNPIPFVQYSQRSAKKLEKILGEHIPQASFQCARITEEFSLKEEDDQIENEEDLRVFEEVKEPELSELQYSLCSSIEV